MSEDAKFKPRRGKRTPRGISVPLLIEVGGGKGEQPARMLDFSESGIRIKSDCALTPGQTVRIMFGKGEGYYAEPCRVAWVGEPGSKREGEAALEFLTRERRAQDSADVISRRRTDDNRNQAVRSEYWAVESPLTVRALVELLEEKGVLTAEELLARMRAIRDRDKAG